MAIQLPKYQRQVGTASGAEAMKTVDPAVATAPYRAMGKAIDASTDAAVEFGMRLKKHKEEEVWRFAGGGWCFRVACVFCGHSVSISWW